MLNNVIFLLILTSAASKDEIDDFNFNKLQIVINAASAEDLKNQDWLLIQFRSAIRKENTSFDEFPIEKQICCCNSLYELSYSLANYLIALASYGDVRTYLVVDPCHGFTITIAAVYLMRFGLTLLDTLDMHSQLNQEWHAHWFQLGLPVNHIISSDGDSKLSVKNYDAVFIDGSHQYDYVLNDVRRYGLLTRRLALHDINDHLCVDVRRLWVELKAARETCGFEEMLEFTYHSHNDSIMGIGLLILPPVITPSCFIYPSFQ